MAKETAKGEARPAAAPAAKPHGADEEAPYYVFLLTYFGYAVLIFFAHLRDFIGKITQPSRFAYLREQNGFAPLYKDFESLYTRRIYTRIRDCWNRPITGVPGRKVTLVERTSDDYNQTFKFTGTTREVLNLASYNYLGFAQSTGPCADAVATTVEKYGIGLSSARVDAGTLDLHGNLESLVAKYVGKEAAIVTSMGFATNSTTIPALVGAGGLIISDSLNHSSIVVGARNSKAAIKVFQHNDIADLEQVLRDAIAQGQPRRRRDWTKIVVIIEGLYSMEGNICNLPAIVALKKKYKFYLYVDEAHSIGALGKTGRGVCEHWGVNTDDVDILMGTFTKSFGAAGGYVAGSKELVEHLRANAHASMYAESMSPPVAQQIISSLSIIMGLDGTDDGVRRIRQLADNSLYFRRGLKKLGFVLYGDDASPIIPLLLYNPAKIAAFSRECLERGIAVVVVGYPATAIIESRARFCVSAAHTREDMDFALKAISEVGDILLLKVGRHRE